MRQKQQAFTFYVGCIEYIQITYYNIYTYNLAIKICGMTSLGNEHSCEILFSFPWGWKEKGDRRTSFPSPHREGPRLCSWRRMISPLAWAQALLEPSSAEAFFYFPWCVIASGDGAGIGIVRHKWFFFIDGSRKKEEKMKIGLFLSFHQQWRQGKYRELRQGSRHRDTDP